VRYLTIAAEYIGSCLKDEIQQQVKCHELTQEDLLCQELEAWNTDYKVIIVLDMEERDKRKNEINILDNRGVLLAKKLSTSIKGGAKVNYFSEGLLKYLVVE